MNTHENIEFENGHLSDEALAMYAEAVLEQQLPPLEEETLVHVAECGECKDKIIDLSTFLRNADTIPAAHFLPQEVERPARKYFAYSMRTAALFFTAFLLVSVYFFVYRDAPVPGPVQEDNLISTPRVTQPAVVAQQVPAEPIDDVTTQPVPVTKEIKPDPELAAHFRENPSLESMIDSNYRSTVPEVFSPKNNARFNNESISFSWQNLKPSSSLTLKIINNDNELMSEYTVGGNGFIFKEKLAPGLYYWKLESNNTLLYIGKFFVKK